MSTPELTRNTEDHNEQPKRLELTPRGRNVLIGLGAAAIVAGGIGLNHQSNEVNAGNVSDAELNPGITSITLEDEANLRSDPHAQNKDFSNRLDQVDLGDSKHVVIPTEDGAYVTQNENGTWYGIKADDLTGVLDVNVENDKDGIVWINDDRASDTTDLE